MNAEPFSFTYFPKSFQKETLEKISKIIKNGGSLQLVGIPGSGSSMIAKALTQMPELRNLYFNRKFTFVLLDGNTLLERNSLNLSRLLLSSLLLDQEVTRDELYLQKETEDKLVEICDRGELVIIIDHAVELNYPELKPFFTNLYNIFRKLEPRLHLFFVVTKSYAKVEVIENFGAIGKLITQNVINIGLLNREDSLWFIKEEEKKLDTKLKKNDVERIYKLSGGFPRTIKRLVESLRQGFKLDDIEKNPNLYLPLGLHLDDILKYKEELVEIPILKTYFEAKNRNNGTENILGMTISQRLTKVEEKILRVLFSKKGEIVAREEGITAIWGETALEISDHAYDQIVHRLRNKLSGATPKVSLETVRGRGHSLKI